MTREKRSSSAKEEYTLANELRWYFNDSGSDMGMRSTFGAFLKGMFSPGHEPFVETIYTDALLRKIARHRRIHKAMIQIPKLTYRVLLALYQDDYQSKYPRAIKNVFNGKTGLAICLFGMPSNDLDQLRDNLTHFIDLCSKDQHDSLQGKEKWEFQVFKEKVNAEYINLHSLLRKMIK